MSKDHNPSGEFMARLESIRKGIEASELMHHALVREAIADACRVAETLKRNRSLWLAFVRHPDWSDAQRRPGQADHKKALQYVFRWLFGLTGEASKRASLYYRAASTLIDEGVTPEEMSQAIEGRGGIKKVASAGKKAASKAAKGRVTVAKKVQSTKNVIKEPLNRQVPRRPFASPIEDSVTYTLIAEFEDGCFAAFQNIAVGGHFRLDCKLIDMAGEARISVLLVRD